VDAIRAGRAYVRARGVAHSPALDMQATSAGELGTFGSTLALDRHETGQVVVTVREAEGQSLRIVRNGQDIATVPITSDDFTHQFPAARVNDEGPLGTWFRVETFDARSRTTIGNPVFFS
jgi:hypothetical protein